MFLRSLALLVSAFLAFAPGVLLASSELKSCLSFATSSTDTKAGSRRMLIDSSFWMAFGHVFLSSSDKMG